MKTCTKCLIEKPWPDFYKGFSTCKKCASAYAKSWQQKNRETKNAINRAWRDRNKDRVVKMKSASNAIAQALKKGLLIKPCSCSKCSSTGRIEAAHADYSKPLEVQWLCVSCHRSWDSNDPKTQQILGDTLQTTDTQ